MCLPLSFPLSSSRFWHHALLHGPPLRPCLPPLSCGGGSAAAEDGEEVRRAEEEEQVWLQEVVY